MVLRRGPSGDTPWLCGAVTVTAHMDIPALGKPAPVVVEIRHISLRGAGAVWPGSGERWGGQRKGAGIQPT